MMLFDQLRSALPDCVDDTRDFPDVLHDESLHPRAASALALVRPRSTAEVVEVVQFAVAHGVGITPRGSGTGLSGAAVPSENSVVVSFERMNKVLSIDSDNHVAVIQPGVRLRELADALRGTGLYYPVHPGELSGSLGGNVNTNAGGMRAVRHGVTRHHVLGLELVLADATVIRTGGPVMKLSSGYDLTQLVVGSEGTLGLVTEITVKLSPVMPEAATLLVPFADLREVAAIVPRLIAAGLQPSLLEYIDILTMAGICGANNLELGVASDIAEKTLAYLVLIVETRTREQLELDIAAAAAMLDEAGALDIYVLESGVATRLIEAREKAFWLAKGNGANEIIDIVVPRSSVPDFLDHVRQLAERHATFVSGCGHIGDGNVHLSVFQSDDEIRQRFLLELFESGLATGGAISGEHGIGRDKCDAYLALSDPHVIALQRRIKQAFDPGNLLNPGLWHGAVS